MGRNTPATAAQANIETADLAGAGDTAELPRQDPPVPLTEVRALTDDQRLGLVAGRLGQVPETEVDALARAGVIDAHPDAVAYARSLAD